MLALILLGAAVAGTASPEALRHEVLPEARLISGIPCTGYARYRDGRLDSCRLAKEVRLGSAAIPAGSPVFLDESGRIARAFLSRDTSLQGHLCRGGGGKWETGFHPSGALAHCWLARPETIEGVPCAAGGVIADVRHGDSSTAFREDGRLRSCLLAAEVLLDGTWHRRGERLERPLP